LRNNHSRWRQQFNLAPGSKEDTATCREFFQDMRRRGLPDRLLVISDGAPGPFRAIEDDLPERRGAPRRGLRFVVLGLNLLLLLEYGLGWLSLCQPQPGLRHLG
jgi:hypothetical protein